MAGYRVSRLLGFHSPGGGAPISYAFLTVIAFTFMLSILRDGFTGLFRPSSETFLIFGGFVAEVLILPPAWWRVLAFGLAHIGLIHVLFNGFALSQIAPIVERNVGSARMLVVITLTQIGAAVGTFIWYGMVLGQPGFTAGASGWLFGLIGYGISYFRSAGGSGSDISSALVRWAIYGFIFGLLVPNINNAAHGGGFLVGLALGTLPAGSPMLERRPGAGWMAAAGVSALLWLGAAGMLALSIFVNWSVAPAG
jgi:rhomboid protease GluP